MCDLQRQTDIDQTDAAVAVQVVEGSDDESAHLLVSKATRHDSGVYEARVKNELGCDVSTFSVVVLGNQKNSFSYLQ